MRSISATVAKDRSNARITQILCQSKFSLYLLALAFLLSLEVEMVAVAIVVDA